MSERLGSTIVLAGAIALVSLGSPAPSKDTAAQLSSTIQTADSVSLPEPVSVPVVRQPAEAPVDADDGILEREAKKVIVTTLVTTAVQAGICLVSGICAPGM